MAPATWAAWTSKVANEKPGSRKWAGFFRGELSRACGFVRDTPLGLKWSLQHLRVIGVLLYGLSDGVSGSG
jgi:hypothetical protein